LLRIVVRGRRKTSHWGQQVSFLWRKLVNPGCYGPVGHKTPLNLIKREHVETLPELRWPGAAALFRGYTASGQLPLCRTAAVLDADRGAIFGAD